MEKLKLVFDVDDVLNDLTPFVYAMMGWPQARRFDVRECPEYNRYQQQVIMDMYANPQVFEDVPWIPGAERLSTLQTSISDVWLCSSCFSEEVREIKRRRLHEKFPFIPDERMVFRVGFGEGEKKQSIKGDVYVDDSIKNLMRFYKEYKEYRPHMLLISRASNMYTGTCLPEYIERVPALENAICLIDNWLAARQGV